LLDIDNPDITRFLKFSNGESFININLLDFFDINAKAICSRFNPIFKWQPGKVYDPTRIKPQKVKLQNMINRAFQVFEHGYDLGFLL
jgi:hypothetical protein